MKKTLLYVIPFILLSTTQAHAVFGVGDIVSDPGSYAYYAEQIAQFCEQVTQLKTMVSTAEDTLDSVDDMKKSAENTYDSVTGAYGRGVRFVNRYKAIGELLDENPRTMEGQYKKWQKVGSKGVNLSNKTIDLLGEPEKNLDVNFRDPRDPLYDHLAEMDKRYHLRQSSLKNSVSQAESLLAGTGNRIAMAKGLADQIDNTKNLKDAQDLTNAFLAEMLTVLNDLLKLTAHMTEAEGLLNFEGADDKVMESRVEIINTRDQRAKERQKTLKKAMNADTEKWRGKAGKYAIQEGEI